MLDSLWTFIVSPQAVQRHRRSKIVTSVTILVIAVIIWSVVGDFSRPSLVFLTLTVTLLAAMFAIMLQALTLEFEQLKLHITRSGIVREAGRRQEEAAWDDITRVLVLQNSRDEPRSVEVFKKGGRSMLLMGFDPLADLIEAIQAGLPASVPVEIKRQRLDMEKPLTIVATLIVSMLFVGAFIRIGGRSLFQGMQGLLVFGLGIYTIVYRPITRTYPSFRILELCCGIMMLLGIMLFLLFFRASGL